MHDPNLKQRIKHVRLYFEEKAGQARQRDGRYKLAQEAKMTRRVRNVLTKQMDWIIARTAGLSVFNVKGVIMLNKKTIYEEIDLLVSDLPFQDELVEKIILGARPSYKKGARTVYNDLEMGNLGVDFSLINNEAARYMESLRTLHLSNFKGSINRETKLRIRNLITEQINSGASYEETARKIRAQGDAGIFSRARSELISVNQVGTAYGEGNREMVDIFQAETHQIMQKSWITTKDDRVTEECKANEDEGWISFEQHFNSGDLVAPRQSNPRCRCDTGYRAINASGNVI